MRNLGKGFLKGLALALAFAPLANVFAATSVSAVDHKTTESGDVRIVLATSGDVPQVSVFATDSPPRIVLDLADTESQASADKVHVGQGAVQQYSAIAAGGKTRLVVDLSTSVAYDYSASGDQVVLSIAAGGGTVAQVEVDQRLVRNAGLCCEPLEVRDRRLVEANRDLSLETPGVRVPFCLREVVLFSHLHSLRLYCCRSARVARRAEMMRMTLSPAR